MKFDVESVYEASITFNFVPILLNSCLQVKTLSFPLVDIIHV